MTRSSKVKGVIAGFAGIVAVVGATAMTGGVAEAATTPWSGPSAGVTATAPGDGPPTLTIDHRNGVVQEIRLNAPVVGMASTPNRQGQWLVASDGGVFAFGSAKFYGSMAGKHLNAPVVGMASTPNGKGYWLVASDGGVFAFGSARFYGSMAGKHLNAPVVGMASTPNGKGYWLVAADGGVFAFGDAPFYGSVPGAPASERLGQAIVGITATAGGYDLTTADGAVYPFSASFAPNGAGVALAN